MENVILSCDGCQLDGTDECSSISNCKKLVLRHLLRILKERYKCGDKDDMAHGWIMISPEQMAEIEKEIGQ